MTDAEPNGPHTSLARKVGRWQLFALAFGCIVGSAWVVVLGDWLNAAAPGGAILGFIGGAVVMLAICGSYAELVARIPVAGGEFEFSRRIFGPRTAFLVGWFSTLFLVAFASFEGIALGWIVGVLVPAANGPILYRLLDGNVTAGGLIIGMTGTVVLGIVNYLGISAAARLQAVVTFVFIAIAAIAMGTGIALGSVHNLAPFMTPLSGQPWWRGALWIFATTPVFLNGFQSVPQVIEERASDVTFRTVARAMYGSIVFACGFYCLVVLASSMSTPWSTLPGRDLPAAAAFQLVIPRGALSQLILVAAALSVAKAWNGVSLWAARLLMAQARAGFLPVGLSAIHPRFGSPFVAIGLVASVNACGILLGRGVLVALLNMTSICISFTLVLTVIAALRLRASPTWRPNGYAVPGGRVTLMFGLLGSVGMAVFAAVDPWLRSRAGIPVEWLLIVVWTTLGGALWLLRGRRRTQPCRIGT